MLAPNNVSALTRHNRSRVQSFLCRPHAWRAIRAHAYAAAGIPHVATSAQPRPRVVFLGGNPLTAPPERRQIVNERALIATTRARFPHAEVVVSEMRDLTPRQQLAELARTTVLVSPLGSKSFRMVLMPDGAQVRSDEWKRA